MNRMSVERRPVVRKVRGVSPYQYALGLDLGQVRDHSAIVVVEQVTSCFDLEAEGYIRVYKRPSTASGTSSDFR